MRSGAEHWPHRIAVEETEDETKEEEEEEEEEAEDEAEEEEAGKADIKSNNPHLTGGE